MPTYAYACTECGHEFDAVQSFSEDSLTTCPACQGRLRKKFGAVGVVFKGSGFYRNDSRNGAGAVPAAGNGGGAEKSGSDSGSSSTGSDSSGSSTKSEPAAATSTTPASSGSAPATTTTGSGSSAA